METLTNSKEYLKTRLKQIELELLNYKKLDYNRILDLKMEQIEIEKQLI